MQEQKQEQPQNNTNNIEEIYQINIFNFFSDSNDNSEQISSKIRTNLQNNCINIINKKKRKHKKKRNNDANSVENGVAKYFKLNNFKTTDEILKIEEMSNFFKTHTHDNIFNDILKNNKYNEDDKYVNANMLKMCIELHGDGRCMTDEEDEIYLDITKDNTKNIDRWNLHILHKEYVESLLNQIPYTERYQDIDVVKNEYYSCFEEYYEK